MMNGNVEHALQSNGFALSYKPNHLSYLQASANSADHDEIRTSFLENGYVWIKGLLNSKTIHDVRKLFFQQCEQAGLLQRGSNSNDGIFSEAPYSQALINQIRQECLMSKAFQGIVQSSAILQLTTVLLDGETEPTQRQLIRCK